MLRPQLTGVRDDAAVEVLNVSPLGENHRPSDSEPEREFNRINIGIVDRGLSQNLLLRAADVTLKERRPLLLAVRETPLNRTHLRNMLAAHEAGAILCPPMPSFYQHPQSLTDLARQFAARICDLLGVPVASTTITRWQGI